MARGAREPAKPEEDQHFIVRKSERVYQWLRDEILAFRMQPGMFIDKVELCDRLGVSKQPVTAALTRLEQEGLVEIYPQRGSYVARLRLGAMTESLFIRAALESAAVRRIAGEGNEVLIRGLQKNIEAQDLALTTDNLNRFYQLDMEFHSAIARAVPYAQVARQVDVGLAVVKRCHEIFRPDTQSLRVSYNRHLTIVNAMATGDGTAAAAEMDGHVGEYTQMLKDFAAQRPELFVG